ncbi:hypothetical protein [Actinophytocola sediminis]
MIPNVRLVLHSRAAHWVAVTTLVMCAVAAVTGPRSLEIDLSARFPPTKLPVVELCTILSATLLAILMRPRLWEWDRIAAGGHRPTRPRAVAAVAAGAGIMLPVLCVPAVVPWLPAETSWGWVLANALIMSATVQLLTPLLSPLAAGGLAVLAWLSCGLVLNLAPQVWLPVSTHRDPDGNWTLVTVLTIAAIVLHARTCGRTAGAHRVFGKEQ